MPVEYLDPEIAGEGEAAVAWQPRIAKPHIPDYSALKEHPHYGQYFDTGKAFQPFPCHIYHPTEPSRVVTAKEAVKYGVSWNREDARWDCTGEWRNRPYVTPKADPNGGGKSLVSPNSGSQPNGMVDVMQAILQQMKNGGAPAAPVLASAMHADPEFKEFLEFKKWKAGQAESVEKVEPVAVESVETEKSYALSEADQKKVLLDLAKEKGIKIHGRSSLDTIKEILDKAVEK